MSQQWKLEQACRRSLKHVRSGSFYTKKSRLTIMLKIIDDLAKIKRLPYSFLAIQPIDITALIQYWRDSQIKSATIVNRLGVLRSVNKLLSLNIAIPTNTELSIKKTALEKEKMTLGLDILDMVYHPITKNILSLQLYFGLTTLEAIRIDPELISHNNALIITRQISHNHKERFVPIKNDIQKATLEKRKLLFVEKRSTKVILNLVRSELSFLNVTSENIRSYYANNRFSAISSSMKKNEATKIIMREMGFSKSRSVYGLIHE